MQKAKILIEVPASIKAKLDALRADGTTASGLIRRLLNEFFALKQVKHSKDGRTTKTLGVVIHLRRCAGLSTPQTGQKRQGSHEEEPHQEDRTPSDRGLTA